MAFPTKTSAYEMDGVGAYSGPVSASGVSSGISRISALSDNAASMINRLSGIASENSARSSQEAATLRSWQEQQNAVAMAFNRQEAAKNRAWQQYMSNTAHQREVKDLRAAGLNPVLSAMGGNGAAVTSGATASGVTSAGAKGDVDMSLSGALVNLLGSLLASQTSLANQQTSALNNLAVAEKYTSMNEIVARLQTEASKVVAGINAGAARYSADTQRWISQHNLNTLPGTINSLLSQFLAGGYGNKIVDGVNSGIDAVKNGDLKSHVKKNLKDAENQMKKNGTYYQNPWNILSDLFK